MSKYLYFRSILFVIFVTLSDSFIITSFNKPIIFMGDSVFLIIGILIVSFSILYKLIISLNHNSSEFLFLIAAILVFHSGAQLVFSIIILSKGI